MSAKRYALLVIGLAAVAAMVLLTRPASPKGAALNARQRGMELLGARIAKLRPQCKVLVLSNPFAKESGYLSENSRFERAGLRGLRIGLGRSSPVKIVFPEVRPEYFTNRQSIIIPPDTSTPLSFLMQPESLDKLAEAHPECRVIVSLIGLPAGVRNLKIWEENDQRCFALLLPDLRVVGTPADVLGAFQRGKLLTAVVGDSESNESLIVTKENVADVLEHQPRALGY